MQNNDEKWKMFFNTTFFHVHNQKCVKMSNIVKKMVTLFHINYDQKKICHMEFELNLQKPLIQLQIEKMPKKL